MAQLYLLDDSYQFIDDGSANLTVEHVSSGNRWTFRQDGTFETGAVSADGNVDPASVGRMKYLTAGDSPAEVINDTTGGDVVIVDPTERFAVSETLQPAAGSAIVRHGAMHSRDGPGQPTFLKTFDGTLLDVPDAFYMGGIGLHGNRASGYSGGLIKSASPGVKSVTLDRCTLEKTAGSAIYLDGAFWSQIRACDVRDHGGRGLVLARTTTAEPSSISVDGETNIARCDAGGVLLSSASGYAGGHDLHLDGTIEACSGPGIEVQSWERALHVRGLVGNHDGPGLHVNSGDTVSAVGLFGASFVDNVQDSTLNAPVGEVHVSETGTAVENLVDAGGHYQAPNGFADAAISVTNADAMHVDLFGTDIAHADYSTASVSGGGATAVSALGVAGLDAAQVASVDGVSVGADAAGRTVVDLPSGGARYQGLRSAEPHAASGSGDVYLDDGTNTADGNPHERLDEPASGTWVDL